MVDRIFALVVLAVVAAYGYIAFTAIRAPFQYDPLGPEAWPRLLAVVAALCCLGLLLRPDPDPAWGSWPALRRLALSAGGLLLYILAFEPLGFIVSTTLFCAGLAWFTGARPLPALLFGLVIGVGGYFLCSDLLLLNVPAGRLLPL